MMFAAWVWRSAFRIASGLLSVRSSRPIRVKVDGWVASSGSVAEFLGLLADLSPQQRACVSLRCVGEYTGDRDRRAAGDERGHRSGATESRCMPHSATRSRRPSIRDDFDRVVADRFTVLDDVPVPDTWSRVQFSLLDPAPVVRHRGGPDTKLSTTSPTRTTTGGFAASLDARGHRPCCSSWSRRSWSSSDARAQVRCRDDDHTTHCRDDDHTTRHHDRRRPGVDDDVSNGWVAVTDGYPDSDIYLVRQGSPGT